MTSSACSDLHAAGKVAQGTVPAEMAGMRRCSLRKSMHVVFAASGSQEYQLGRVTGLADLLLVMLPS